MSKFEITPSSLYKENSSFKQLEERFLKLIPTNELSIYIPFSVSEKTNFFATLNELPSDLDIYIGKYNSAQSAPIYDSNNRPVIQNSSTNPGKEAESIFAQLPPGEYWFGIISNIPDSLINEEIVNTAFEWSLDGKTFDETTNLSNDPLLNRQWHLFNTGLVKEDRPNQWIAAPNVDILAPEAWKLGFTADIPIAIIDMGIDITHPDLIQNLWTNPKEIAGNGIDDDNNGYTDDIHGWNFAAPDGGSSEVKYGPGKDSHGTHVAGIAGARGNNGIGVSGVAWETQLMTLDVVNGGGGALREHQAEAIRYAVDNGAKVINMSLGGNKKVSPKEFLNNDLDVDVKEALQYAYDNDVFIAMAAGNEGSEYTNRSRYNNIGDLDEYVSNPAIYSEMFGNIASVSALNAEGKIADYSSYGENVSIIAPGGYAGNVYIGDNDAGDPVYTTTKNTQILSTVAVGTGDSDDPNYGYMQGTSMASPVIAGMAALIRAQNNQISARDTLAILRAGAFKISKLQGIVNQGNQANLYKSLEIAQRWEGPDTLTGIGQEISPVLNLSSLTTAQSLNGTLNLTRDASLDPIIGFYQVLDVNGTITDGNGNALKPGDANYNSAALNTGNLIEDLNNLEVENGSSLSVGYSINGSRNGTYLAPFAITGDNTWFAWKEANSDGLDHFKVLGANQFGLDDQAGPDADKDFQDVVMNFTSSEII